MPCSRNTGTASQKRLERQKTNKRKAKKFLARGCAPLLLHTVPNLEVIRVPAFMKLFVCTTRRNTAPSLIPLVEPSRISSLTTLSPLQTANIQVTTPPLVFAHDSSYKPRCTISLPSLEPSHRHTRPQPVMVKYPSPASALTQEKESETQKHLSSAYSAARDTHKASSPHEIPTARKLPNGCY